MTAPAVKQRDADATQEKLLVAALASFSSRGFDASSTRHIEEEAGVNRGLINYHFGSKRALWEATASYIMKVASLELAGAMAGAANVDPPARLRYLVRAYVKFCARHPEVNRLMIQEGMQDDWRLDYLVETGVRPWYRSICAQFEHAREMGIAPDMDDHNFYYILTGAATLMFSNAAEARKLTGKNLLDENHVNQHADILANLLFPEGPK